MKIYNGYLNNLRESYFVCIFATLKVEKNASVAELVDALDSKSCSFGSAGSIPARGTKALDYSRAFLFTERNSLLIIQHIDDAAFAICDDCFGIWRGRQFHEGLNLVHFQDVWS